LRIVGDALVVAPPPLIHSSRTIRQALSSAAVGFVTDDP
jgi:hypothetical protein